MSPQSLRRSLLAGLASLALVTTACTVDDGGSTSAEGGKPANANVPAWCGSKQITLGLADGFGDNNWRKVTTAEAKAEVAKCPNVTSFTYTDGQGNTQKAISDIQGLVAKGTQAIVVFPDAGQAVLPALRSAYKAGVVTVPYRVNPGGTPGQDYDAFVSTNFEQAGVLWGQWLVKALNGKGKVLNLGGPAANSQSLDEYKGMQSVLKDHPGIQFVGTTPYEVTNWDAAQTQRVITAALAKNPEIDAITTDFGAALASSFSAFTSAGRKIPAIATEDANQLACNWQQQKDGGNPFQLFTVSSQNAMSRLAIDVAVAKATGGVVPKDLVYPQSAFEDSISGQPHPVTCDKELPSDAFVSSSLSKADQTAALK
ncbi:substrate-binding domain-containing protein [Amycolatopsis carbonis]|uniref:Substrate-binding domain-containing protein n=1 Tax=Amycolatopsis carbonis TaxID=715471 RepID=A0A9Y2N278_9PSEU|nr:substrate-binding domain-containing protein [Amycolatopsis sp. 2-15]WIX83739.1 substrate-binding domain-containing protein [Amycolatopsis sp. 2-15]